MSRIYKGSDKVIRIPKPGIEISAYEDVQIFFYTDGDNVVKKEMVDVDIDEHDITVKLYDRDTNAFNEGVLRYTIKVKLSNDKFDDGYDTVTDVQTDYFIKASAISGETVPIVPDVPTGDCSEVVEELNNEKEQLEIALNGAMTQLEERDTIIAEKDATITEKDAEIAVLITEAEEAYDNGVVDQKGKLTSTTISSNGTYTREDGWNEVNVNVPNTSDSYANTNAMFADMMLKMATYEYVSMYEIRSTLGVRTYTVPEDSMAVVSSYERLEPFKTAGTYDLDEYSTFITLFSHNRNAIIETTGSKKKISLYNTAPRIYGSGWEEMHLYHTECSNIILGLKTYCHTQTPPTVNGVSVNATIYYPKGADYSSFIEQWGSVATILPFDY